MKRRATRFIIAGLALLIVLAIVGTNEPALEQTEYCRNVAEGIWPDYHGTFKEECGGENPPKFNEDLTK